MRYLALSLAVLLAIQLGLPGTTCALDQFKMLDVRIGDRRILGRVLTHDEHSCWILQRDGQLHQLEIEKVNEFVEVQGKFKPNSALELKSQLQAEFGKNFEVRASSHYVVVAQRGTTEAHLAVFERIFREFGRSFRARGFQLPEPEFPLVAIVFPDQSSFLKYCQSEGSHLKPGILGCYLPKSNRVAMFERPSNIEVDNTIIHEATHQVAFNTGIHLRLAKHPKWVVEGLATVFEAEGVRVRQSTNLADRVNRERYLWFRDYARIRRAPHSLKTFVSEDQVFDLSMADAYSEAWAFSFFLIETRAADYSKYFKLLVERDPLVPYEGEVRLKDFTAAFGSDFDGLETTFLRFIKRIAER